MRGKSSRQVPESSPDDTGSGLQLNARPLFECYGPEMTMDQQSGAFECDVCILVMKLSVTATEDARVYSRSHGRREPNTGNSAGNRRTESRR
jgi:hypothetical protein